MNLDQFFEEPILLSDFSLQPNRMLVHSAVAIPLAVTKKNKSCLLKDSCVSPNALFLINRQTGEFYQTNKLKTNLQSFDLFKNVQSYDKFVYESIFGDTDGDLFNFSICGYGGEILVTNSNNLFSCGNVNKATLIKAIRNPNSESKNAILL